MPCTLGMRWGLCTCSSREVAVLQLSVVVGRVLEAGSACDSCVWGGGGGQGRVGSEPAGARLPAVQRGVAKRAPSMLCEMNFRMKRLSHTRVVCQFLK